MRKKDVLHYLLDMAEDLALIVYTRERMFPGIEMYSANQIAAADAAIAALSPEERKATFKIAFKAALAASDKAQ